MKDYIKPSFTLAGLFPVALAAGSGCYYSSEQIQAAFNRFGWTYTDKAINEADGCAEQFPIEMYCKFTAIEAGAAKILNS